MVTVLKPQKSAKPNERKAKKIGDQHKQIVEKGLSLGLPPETAAVVRSGSSQIHRGRKRKA